MAAKNNNRNITRIDIGEGRLGTHGWKVRFSRRGQKVDQFFRDSDYGGKRKSMRAAREFRDETEASLEKFSRRENATRPLSNNTSGIPGVRRRVIKTKRGDREWEYEVWTATGSPRPYQRRIKDFYVSKLGESKAKRMAIKQRRQWEAEMDQFEG